MDNPSKESLYYNAVNIALNGDYKKIKDSKVKNWEEAWLGIKNNFPKIEPEKEFEKLSKASIKLILNEEEDFPKNLKEMSWSPLAIYIQGNLGPIQSIHSISSGLMAGKVEQPSIAIVGTRRATIQGKSLAKQIAKELSESGIQIISGLAMGIDESAHSGTLENNGKTIAVLPTGLDNIYPRQNHDLAKRIIKAGGALVSEFPFGYRPYASSFIQRNRIISALSLATIIIEAPEKSGALATARFAIEQNREVLVAPGPANHSNYKGSHKLIREGAGLITCAGEILEDLGIVPTQSEKISARGGSAFGGKNQKITEEEQAILEAISQLGWPASVDKISEVTKIQVQKINQIITFLTIKDILK